MLLRFKNISVRDDNSFKIVKEMTSIAPIISFDPVLIGDFKVKMNEHQIQLK